MNYPENLTPGQREAYEYIAAWGGHVRPGIMREVITGHLATLALMDPPKYSARQRQALTEKIEVFKAHYQEERGVSWTPFRWTE